MNLKVIQAAYSYNFKSVMLVAAGGIIPEIIYSSIAVCCSWLLLSNPLLFDVLQFIAIPFFLVTGLIMMTKKNAGVKQQDISGQTLFLDGFLAGALNPMLFTFWLMIITFLTTGNHLTLDSWGNRVAFVLGTAIGAFLLLLLFAVLTLWNKPLLERKLSGNLNKITGLIFIILAIYQFIRWVYE
ncbi:MAG: hypothetical protein M3Q95_11770 [Bacteroidota bacterium]|nr:hypothetical protein [Bacteroidota bacterium]